MPFVREMPVNQDIVALWKERSVTISATVKEVDSVEEALNYCLELCASASPHEELMGPESGTGNTLAAPGFPADQTRLLQEGCAARGLRFVNGDLRSRAGGIEVGVAWALAGLADTGTCVVQSTDEDVRLATMLPETGVILLRRSQILPSLEDSAELLHELFSGDGSSFVAFISGPSRTADIERVLTLGVHGPLALHAVLINDVEQENAQ